MKHIVFIVFLVGVMCISCDKKIDNLPSREMKYNELPVALQHYLSDSVESFPEMFYFVEENDRKVYQFEDIPTIIGPWTKGTMLINLKNNTKYKIARSTPVPYILYKDKLYIPTDDLYFGDDEYKKVKFIVYDLR